MSADLALTIATPFLGLGVSALLILPAWLLFATPEVRRSTPDDRSWRQEMLRVVAAAKLGEELQAARVEIAHRREREQLARIDARTRTQIAPPAALLGRPPTAAALAVAA